MAFRNIDGKKIANTPDLYRQVHEYDFVEKIKPLLRQGFYFRKSDGKLSANFTAIHETPWIAIHSDPSRECLLWHQILFKFIDVIPSGCLNCWKVVARPNTFHEFAQLHDLMRTMNRSSKIGIEVRAYVQSLYGAYWYNNSLEEGNATKEYVKKMVHENISPDIDVHLKRYCTEFEMRHGDSDKFVQSEEDKIWEKLAYEIFALEDIPSMRESHPIVKRHIINNIIEYAAKMKDPTIKDYNEGKVPFPDIVKYDRDSLDPNKYPRKDPEPET